MIAINLLPDEMRVKVQTPSAVPVIPIAIVSGALFCVLTVFFYVDFLSSAGKLSRLEAKWSTVQPQYVLLTRLQADVDGKLKQEKEFMENFVTTQRPLTHMMSWITEFLPDGVWLTEMNMERLEVGGKLFLQGVSLPSKKQSSVEQIETFLHSLKGKMPDVSLSLTTTRLQMEKINLTQFMANFEWGKKNSGKDPKAKP